MDGVAAATTKRKSVKMFAELIVSILLFMFGFPSILCCLRQTQLASSANPLRLSDRDGKPSLKRKGGRELCR